MNLAQSKDIKREYVDAVKQYENQIATSDQPAMDDFINLSFLYWAFAALQMEFNIPNMIPDEWSLIGGQRFSAIIEMGLARYPDSVELTFWGQYFPYRLFGADFSERDCEKILGNYGMQQSLVPYFYLHLFDGLKYSEEINHLLDICNRTPTAKNLYIRSFL
ncbi:hypothetical protein [Dyadobacter psychrotolerans]|uniref:Uncharacterized protein n=1 Tax=Dyadobacter psychrotolerans TaxID=2541721 RepID=A0A4R5D6P7_9BACT|nr:hypothetical protein [Dyadobacter psychrotolerans]TDE09036.1 hypothetical protein E0F88_31635 [Dyadobacter psychrotolerans]